VYVIEASSRPVLVKYNDLSDRNTGVVEERGSQMPKQAKPLAAATASRPIKGVDAFATHLVSTVFTSIADAIDEVVAAIPAAAPIVNQDSTGLWHSDDYRVCKDKAGIPHTCPPFVAKLIEALNVAKKEEGIFELHRVTLLDRAETHCGTNSSLANEFRTFKTANRRLDHRLATFGVWKTLVFPGKHRGCYRLFD
jgi:hypothetical protein